MMRAVILAISMALGFLVVAALAVVWDGPGRAGPTPGWEVTGEAPIPERLTRLPVE